MLRFMGLQRVRDNCLTELNRTEFSFFQRAVLYIVGYLAASLSIAQLVKNSPAVQGTLV